MAKKQVTPAAAPIASAPIGPTKPEAGVMAIGFEEGEIENSIPRVVRLLDIMTAGGNAFEERLNKFNRSMNRGYRLSRWFAKEFGSTQCRAITGCDFSDPAGVGDYVESNRIAGCREMAEKVAP